MSVAWHIGTSGWSYPQWKTGLYAGCTQSGRLARYAESFSDVELNSSFYRLPSESMIASWCERTPPDFCFALKAWREITHNRKLRDCEAPLAECIERLQLFGDKMGPVLFQLPPSLQRDDTLLAEFLTLIPSTIMPVFEFRHPSWQAEPVQQLLADANATLCQAHCKEWSGTKEIIGKWAYIRLHGTKAWFKGSYSKEFLEELISWVEASQAQEAFVFFNNTIEGNTAPDNALLLQQLVQ